MSPVAQHKLFIHLKRINCKTVESHHISIHAETAACIQVYNNCKCSTFNRILLFGVATDYDI